MWVGSTLYVYKIRKLMHALCSLCLFVILFFCLLKVLGEVSLDLLNRKCPSNSCDLHDLLNRKCPMNSVVDPVEHYLKC